MAVERQNPLPPGRYWVTVAQPQLPKFNDWLMRAIRAGHVKVEKTSRNLDGSEWVLFRTVTGVRWEGPGLPDRADANTEPEIQRAPPEASHVPLSDMISTVLEWAPFVLLAFGAAYVLRELKVGNS